MFQLNDPGNNFSSIDQDELLVPSLDALQSFDESSLDELDHLISSMDPNLEFSEDGPESSDTSMKFSSRHLKNSEDDRDVSSEEENENAFLPNTYASEWSTFRYSEFAGDQYGRKYPFLGSSQQKFVAMDDRLAFVERRSNNVVYELDE